MKDALGLLWSVATVVLALGSARASFAQSACEVGRVNASHGGFFVGYAVDISETTALVGAFGAAYVFGFDGTTWVQTQQLLASDGNNDQFGQALAIDGERALVAAPSHLDERASGSGSVYFFRYDGSSWVEQQELFASDGDVGDRFGHSVSICGDVALIGAVAAVGDDDKGIQTGAVYVFRFDGSTWVEDQKFFGSDSTAGDSFGLSVAIDGDIAVIGSPVDDSACRDPGGCNSGAAYVFRFDGSIWIEEQKLVPSDTAVQDQVGSSVSISGQLAVIGAYGDDDNGSTSGAAYVFRFDPDTALWEEEQKLLASDGSAGDQFGRSVSLDGDTAIVGAWGNDQVGPIFGAAYIFRYDGSSFVEQQKLLPKPGKWTAFFGFSVAISGDTAVVGAHGEGHAYLYMGASGTDCNSNMVSDACDIFSGTSDDTDGNGIPDECECPWDCDGSADGLVTVQDLLVLIAQFQDPNPPCDAGGTCDFDGSGCVDVTDLLKLIAQWSDVKVNPGTLCPDQ